MGWWGFSSEVEERGLVSCWWPRHSHLTLCLCRGTIVSHGQVTSEAWGALRERQMLKLVLKLLFGPEVLRLGWSSWVPPWRGDALRRAVAGSCSRHCCQGILEIITQYLQVFCSQYQWQNVHIWLNHCAPGLIYWLVWSYYSCSPLMGVEQSSQRILVKVTERGTIPGTAKRFTTAKRQFFSFDWLCWKNSKDVLFKIQKENLMSNLDPNNSVCETV